MTGIGINVRIGLVAAIAAAAAALPAAGQPAMGQPPAAQPTSPLDASSPIPVPRTAGYFDYMTVDAKARRLLLAHSANDQLAIVDMDAGAVIKQIDLGDGAGGSGVAVDERDGKYFVGTAVNKVVDINRKNLVLQSNIPMPGPIDALSFDPKNDTLYADEFNGTHVWAINAKTDKVVATIAVPGKPEYVDYDPVTDRIYQNIELPEPSMVFAIDTKANSVESRWPVAPAVRVHGLAIDSASGRVFSVGLNGKLAVIDVKTGSMVTTVDIAPRVDQIAFDAGNRRVYCPSGTGVMSVVQETDDGAALLGSVSIPRDAHSVAIDPKTHAVWISFGAPESDYVEKLTPST